MPERTDIEIIQDYLDGDTEAFDVIVHRYLTIVYNFVWRLSGGSSDTSDITQEVFIKVWRKIEQFDRKQNFKTWLFTIARHTAIDWFRKRHDKTFSSLAGPEDLAFEETIADREPLADEIFARAELKENLQTLIARLPEKYQTVVFLKHDEELTFEEMSKVLEAPLNTLKSRYWRALLLLREYLGNAPK